MEPAHAPTVGIGGSPVALLVRFVVAIALPIAVGVVLLASDGLATWDGQAIARRPADPEASSVRVVIATQDGGAFERTWSSELVSRLTLPVAEAGTMPSRAAEGAPATKKSRFRLHYLVQVGEGFEVVPSTTPQAAMLGVLTLLVAVALRNMAVSGAPWSIEPRAAYLPAAQARSGQILSLIHI